MVKTLTIETATQGIIVREILVWLVREGIGVRSSGSGHLVLSELRAGCQQILEQPLVNRFITDRTLAEFSSLLNIVDNRWTIIN